MAKKATAAPLRTVMCPVCLEDVVWDGTHLYEPDDGSGAEPRPLDVTGVKSVGKLRDRVQDARKKCPNPTREREHFIPGNYDRYAGSAILVGLVGGSATGKSHLLASMIGEIENDGLGALGIRAQPLDRVRHERYLDDFVRPLLSENIAPARTAFQDAAADFVDAFVLTRHGTSRAVLFYDIAGEQFRSSRKGSQFLLAAGGLMFVVDAERVRPAGAGATVDTAFSSTLDRLLRVADASMIDVPAAIVVTKSDRIRFDPPVSRWYRQPSLVAFADGAAADWLTEESRDVFAYLYANGGQVWLRPFADCRRTTLHFASATGSSASEGPAENTAHYQRGVRPVRVLEPLVSLLAMAGFFGNTAGIGE